MDWRFTLIGAIMIGIGTAISLINLAAANTGPIEEFVQGRMYAQAGGILAGIGVLVLLVSFGLQRRRRGFSRSIK